MTPNRLIKMLCKYLRHRPDELKLVKTDRGVHISDIVNGLQLKSVFMDAFKLLDFIRNDPHKRLRCDDNYYVCPTYGRNSREVPLSFFGKCKIHNDPVWFPTRLSVFNKYIQCGKWVIPSQGRHLCVYAEFNDAATHAARYHKFDTSLVVKVQNWNAISMLIKSGRAYLPYIRPEIVKEVRKIVPALGCTWEQSKVSNIWSYSIIHADTQKK